MSTDVINYAGVVVCALLISATAMWVNRQILKPSPWKYISFVIGTLGLVAACGGFVLVFHAAWVLRTT